MKRKPHPKAKTVYLRKGDQIHKLEDAPRRFAFSGVMVFTIMLIFFGALSSAVAAAHMANTRREVAQARQQRDAALDINRTLAGQIPTPFTLDEIEQLAQERLGMVRPDPSQIIYINIPPASHVIFNPNPDILPAGTSFWGELRTFVTDIFNRVFGG